MMIIIIRRFPAHDEPGTCRTGLVSPEQPAPNANLKRQRKSGQKSAAEQHLQSQKSAAKPYLQFLKSAAEPHLQPCACRHQSNSIRSTVFYQVTMEDQM